MVMNGGTDIMTNTIHNNSFRTYKSVNLSSTETNVSSIHLNHITNVISYLVENTISDYDIGTVILNAYEKISTLLDISSNNINTDYIENKDIELYLISGKISVITSILAYYVSSKIDNLSLLDSKSKVFNSIAILVNNNTISSLFDASGVENIFSKVFELESIVPDETDKNDIGTLIGNILGKYSELTLSNEESSFIDIKNISYAAELIGIDISTNLVAGYGFNVDNYVSTASSLTINGEMFEPTDTEKAAGVFSEIESTVSLLLLNNTYFTTTTQLFPDDLTGDALVDLLVDILSLIHI